MTNRPIPGKPFEIRNGFRVLAVAADRTAITLGSSLTDGMALTKTLTDDDRAAIAWALLPDDVREKLAEWYGDAQSNSPHPVIAYVRRMTALPPWEPSDEAVEVTARAIANGFQVTDAERDEARHILFAQHEAGLFREDDR